MQVGEVDRNAVAGNYVSLKLNIRDAAYTHVTTNLVITIYVMNVFWSAFESRNKILDGSSPYAVETLHLRRLKSIKNNIIRINQKNETNQKGNDCPYVQYPPGGKLGVRGNECILGYALSIGIEYVEFCWKFHPK